MADPEVTTILIQELLSEEVEEYSDLPGTLPLEDITVDGGGQLSKVGPPYDGTGGVVRGTEREIEEDHFGPFHRVRRWLAQLLHSPRGE